MATQLDEVWQIYEPLPPPTSTDHADLILYLLTEYQRLAAFVQILSQGQQEIIHVAPAKPRGGMIRIADGTNWNPGGGRGVYWYDPGVPGWVKL